jgi:hypothetical protein
MSKITRASISNLYFEKLLLGKYITINIWGLLRIASLSRNTYILSTTYKKSKYYIVVYNSDRKSYFTDLQNQVTFSETQTRNKVKRLYLNNTPEFILGQVKN